MTRGTLIVVMMLLVVVSVATAKDTSVSEVQRMLNALGFDAGSADGVMGSRTRKAIQSFRRRVCLWPSTDVTDKFIQVLRAAARSPEYIPETSARCEPSGSGAVMTCSGTCLTVDCFGRRCMVMTVQGDTMVFPD